MKPGTVLLVGLVTACTQQADDETPVSTDTSDDSPSDSDTAVTNGTDPVDTAVEDTAAPVPSGPTVRFAATSGRWSVPTQGDAAGFWTHDSDSAYAGAWSTMDLDGDGLVDLVHHGDGESSDQKVFGFDDEPYWNVHHGNGSGFDDEPVTWSVPALEDAPNGAIAASTHQFTNGRWSTMDIDGDGELELVHHSTPSTPVTSTFSTEDGTAWRVYDQVEGGFSSEATDWSLPDDDVTGYGFYGPSAAGIYYGWWTTTDMDGDGRPDLVVTAGAGLGNDEVWGLDDGSPHWRVHLNTGEGFSDTATEWSVPDLDTEQDKGVYLSEASVAAIGFWSLLDLTGDGLPDLVQRGHTVDGVGEVFQSGGVASWKVYANTGSGFQDTATSFTVPDIEGVPLVHLEHLQADFDKGSWSVRDMNGDGIVDLAVFGESVGAYQVDVLGLDDAPHWDIYPGGDDGFSLTPTPWAVPALGGSGVWQPTASSSQTGFWLTLDMDGDGHLDLVQQQDTPESLGANAVFEDDDGPYWKIWRGEPATP